MCCHLTYVLLQTPDLYIYSFVDVFVGRSPGQSSTAILNVTEIFFENDEDCVTFSCLIKTAGKPFWVSQISHVGKFSHIRLSKPTLL